MPPAITDVRPDEVSTLGGTVVTIRGRFFTGATGVSFGEAQAVSYTVKDHGTRITATAPAHSPGSVHVTVTTSFGSSRQRPEATVDYKSPPSVTSISPPSGSPSGGTTVTITGTGLRAATGVTFGTATGSRVKVKSDRILTVVSPAHAVGTVDVQVVSKVGPSAATQADRFTYGSLAATGDIAGTVTAGGTPVPAVTVTIVPDDPSLSVVTLATASDGTYRASTLQPGHYVVCFSAATYAPNCWQDQPQSSPQSVSVTAGATTGGVDAHLTRAGDITGTVTSATTGSVLSGVVVDASAPTGDISTSTAADGTYDLGGLAAGSYTVCFDPAPDQASAVRYQSKCLGQDPGTNPVAVTAAGTTSGVNAQMTSRGGIEGSVTVAGGGSAAGVLVEAQPAVQGADAGYTTTRADGTYTIAGLAAGDYTVCFYPGSAVAAVGQCYNAKPADDTSQADTVSVADGAATGNIDATLAQAGGVAGTVTSGGSPVGGVDVQAIPLDGTGSQADATTGSDGTYRLSGLAPGTYQVCFYPAAAVDGPGAACYGGQPADGTGTVVPVTVTGGQTTGGIDIDLPATGAVSGNVTVPGGGPLAGATIEVNASDGSSTSYAVTGADGTYSVTGLVAGTYQICAYPPEGPYLPSCTSADVAIALGATTSGVNITVNAGGSIAGTVTDASSGTGLAGVEVLIIPLAADGTNAPEVTTGADGTYTVSGLAAGDYAVCFFADGYTAQCYSGLPADGSATPTPVTVSGATAAAIDAALVPGN